MRNEPVPDKRIVQKVTQRLSRTGTSQCKVTVAVRSGQVSLCGEIRFENQRGPILNSARRVEGVRSVVDQLRLKAAPKKWKAPPARFDPGPETAGAPEADTPAQADGKS